jgi:PadR family transcriptional regulator, regulatory protein AphA
MREATTRYVILGALEADGPLSGYDIRGWIAQSVGYFWTESFGQLYPELKRLAGEGLIAPVREARRNPRDRQRYRITADGRRVLQAWVEQPARKEPVRAEFLLKLLFSRRPGPAAARRHLEDIRSAQAARARAFAGARAAMDQAAESPDLVYALMVLRYGQRISAMRLAWVEESVRLLEALESGGNEAVLAALRAEEEGR